MSDKKLPKDWKIVKVGKFVNSTKGKKPKRISKEKTIECYLPYVNIKAFEKGIIDEYTDGVGCVICEEGDFLMVWDGSRSGYVGKGIKGALGSTLVKLNFPDINNNYAYYFLQSKYLEINTRAKGVGIPHVDPNILWNYELLIPPPKNQEEIVSKIEELFSELDKGIEDLKTAQQQLKTYRQSVLKWAFEGKLTNENVKDGELPKGWKSAEMGNICSLVTDGKHGNCEDELNSGYYFLSAKDVKFDTLNYENARQITKKGFEETHKRTNLKPGDICMVNTGASIGRIALAPYNDKTFQTTFQKSVAVIKTIPEILDNKYCSYALKSDLKQLMKISSGTAVPNLLLGTIKKHQINLPSSLEEQLQIVQEIESRLSVADKMEESIAHSLLQAESLRQSILKKAFSGELV